MMPNPEIDHVLVCRRSAAEGGWLRVLRERQADGSGVWMVADVWRNGVGRVAIDAFRVALVAQPKADATFSTRTVAEIVAEPVVEDSQLLASAVGGASLMVLLPARDALADLWSQIWRDPTGGLSGGEQSSRFRVANLDNEIAALFARENASSFDPPTRYEAKPGMTIHRPSHHREVLIRRSWVAAALLPTIVPSGLVLLTRSPEEEKARVEEIQRRRRVKNAKARRKAS